MPYRREISEDDLMSLHIIREIRQDLKLTQAKLGEISHNSRALITAVENKHSGLTWTNALVILQRLGCRIAIECPELDRVYVVKEKE
jgi:transcriptional regulator with XRE-family HTH domain